MVSVDIGGYDPGAILDYRIESERSDTLDHVTVGLPNTSTNRSNISSNDSLTVTESGETTFRGEVSGDPIPEVGRLEINGLGERRGLLHREAHQVVYDTESSEAVKTLATTQAKSLPRTEIHVGDDLTDWTFDADVAQLYNGTRAGLYNWGTDLIFLGARKGTTQQQVARYGNVTSTAIEDGIFELQTRLLVNNVGNNWNLAIELVTPGDTTYKWTPDIPGTGFEPYTLKSEDAVTSGQVSETGTLEYRFTPKGETGQNIGIYIDNAHTIPFRRKTVSNAPSTSGVVSTGRTITRRVDETVAAVLSDLATEDQVDWWVDDSTLYYRDGPPDTNALSITQGTTQVVEADIDKDYESVINAWTVIGDDDIEETAVDQASINFYGERIPDSVTDKDIKTAAEAQARAEGHLNETAWDDTLGTWTIADREFRKLATGQRIPVTWGRADLDGTFTVETLVISEQDVQVTVGGSSA